MKKLLMALSSVFALISCKKETTELPAPQPEPVFTKKITRVFWQYQDGSSETETFKYDAAGRVTEYANDDYRWVLDYNTDGKIFATETRGSTGAVLYKYDCDLNTKKNVTKMTITREDGSLYASSEFLYNNDDYIIKATTTGPFSAYGFEYEIEEGNVVSKLNTGTGQRGYYSYDKTKYNSDVWSYAGRLPGNMFGKKCKNLNTEYKETDPAGALIYHSVMSHAVSADGYLIKTHYDFRLSGRYSDATYTFE